MLKSILQDNNIFYYVAYARVSSSDQVKGISLKLQIDEIQDWVSRQVGTWVCVAKFREDENGDYVSRAEMDIIVELAKKGKVNAVVVRNRDRFARDMGTAVILERELHRYKVRLFSVEQGEFTPGAKNIYLDAIERVKPEDDKQSLLKNMREKRYAYVANGSAPSAGHAMYGYNKVGKKQSLRYQIDEVEAEVVRTIFDMYIKRYAFEDIANYLNEQGIPQPSDKMLHDGSRQRNHRHAKTGWSKWSIRTIVKHAESYKGLLTAYRYAIREDAPEERKIEIPAIIDDDTYTKVMYIGDQSRHVFFRREDTPKTREYLLTGRFACSCGYTFSGQKAAQKKKATGEIVRYNYYYRCSSMAATREKKTACTMHFLPAEKVEGVVWDFVSRILADPKTAIARYKQQQTDTQKVIDNAIAHIESIDEVIAELNAEREQVLTLFRKRLIKEDRLEADVTMIDRQVEKLMIERVRWSNVIESNTITDAQLHQLEFISAAIRNELELFDTERKSDTYDKLRLKVSAAREDGEVVLYVSILGAVPERLELVQDTSNSDSASRYQTTNKITFHNALVFRLPLCDHPNILPLKKKQTMQA